MKKILLFLFVIASCNSTSDKYGLIYDSTCNCWTTKSDYIENHPPTVIFLSDPKTNSDSVDNYVDSFMSEQRDLLFNISDTAKEYRLARLGIRSDVPMDYKSVLNLRKMYQVYDSIYPEYKYLNYRCVYLLTRYLRGEFERMDFYKCDVPYKNLSDIENFTTSYVWDRYVRDNGYGSFSMKPDEIMQYFWHFNYDFSKDMGYFWKDIPYINDNCNKIESGKGTLTPNVRNLVEYSKLDLKERGGFGTSFFCITYDDCKKTVVFAPVFGGYIMITKW